MEYHVEVQNSGGIMAFMCILQVIALAIAIVCIVGMWKVFTKAGKPGWPAIIPIYNTIILLEIVEKPIWWIILLFVPIANLVVAIVINIELAKKFGKDIGFAIGLILVPFIFMPILGFGSAKYLGATAGGAASPPPPPVA